MTETTVNISGMMCGMCEAHICDVIRARFAVRKVTASHRKGQAVILSESGLDEAARGHCGERAPRRGKEGPVRLPEKVKP